MAARRPHVHGDDCGFYRHCEQCGYPLLTHKNRQDPCTVKVAKCGTCLDTGQVWTAGEDGTPYGQGCPDCDTPHPLAVQAARHSRMLRESDYLNAGPF
jgi:hypothetical protein